MPERIKEIIIVEGRDDERAVKQAVDAETIATHGYGITQDTWNLIERAYRGPGIIVLTDPDRAGESIRGRIAKRFPNAKHAFIPRDDASLSGDIGIENAKPESIRKALSKARCSRQQSDDLFTIDDLIAYSLVGTDSARKKRDRFGAALGIGYGNTKTFLKRLNYFGISREEFNRYGQAILAGNNKEDL